MAESPLALVDRWTDQRVSLRLKDGREFEGRLLGVDDHLNVVLDDASETSPEATRRLGRVVVRGSSVVALFAPNGVRPRGR
jgi:small nuclear ribonucleoprotein